MASKVARPVSIGAQPESQGLAMRLYWVLVASLSLGLLALTVHVATPPDAAELIESQGR